MKYPVYQPYFNGKEKEFVNDCIDSSWISSKGKYVERFEREYADYIGVKYAASVCNGTMALHLALMALGIGEGDEVIVPTFTILLRLTLLFIVVLLLFLQILKRIIGNWILRV